MSSENISARLPLVYEVGGGKAAFALHGPNWLAVGCDLNITDTNQAALTPYKEGVKEVMRTAYEAGNLTFRRLGELAATPDIIDITTPAGHHVEAIHQTLEELQARGVTGSEPVWLIEKPMTSSSEEAQALIELVDEGHLDICRTFINEHYLASKSLRAVEMVIAMEKARGEEQGEEVTVTNVDVVFNKNRIPDVLEGRFTDAALGSYGIEMPHELVIGYRLAGIKPEETQPEILENHYYEAVAGVPLSEGNYTVLRVANGATIRMAQGLGPYTMQANGDIIPRQDQPIERYAEVMLSNGAAVRVELGPVAGLARLETRLTWRDGEGSIHQEVMEDNIFRTIMGGIATFAATGVQPYFADDFNLPNGFLYAHILSQLAADGKR
jgi:hypothetical protein